MQDIRCQRCNKLLAKAIYQVLEIKCSRCGVINQRAASPIDMKGTYHGKAPHSLDRRKT
ncbi:Com family DNA-binding transcriptional regulator [Amphritea sp. 2_MG-2023]|uniref:Com family DNA-binding transcriptional regulator n=1 Tax=Amphritea TaxID=515417 RepID=UPI001C077704|nr:MULTISPECIES: Com family DNA-binding transcriptional regulator [Amphritea]MBU2967051.1 Com family DNA-binding transcriptional regulator [Amphritea atlantica]MDO6419396.1 Com family DNA-binding transcriptional regulator [Amphritea sp. 2_MG-2023]